VVDTLLRRIKKFHRAFLSRSRASLVTAKAG